MEFPILTVLALLPAVGALSLIFLRGTLAKQVALAVSVLVLVLAIILAIQFDVGGGMQFTEQARWIALIGAYYALGLDGIGLTLVLLVAIVTPVVIIASWRDFDDRAASSKRAQNSEVLSSEGRALSSEARALSLSRGGATDRFTGSGRGPSTEPGRDPSTDPGRDPLTGSGSTLAPRYGLHVFFGLVLAVEACALFLFLATDVFLFYVFFEVILIPMYFLIGGFGPGHGRTYAAAKFLIFGLLGGFVMLASVIGLYVQSANVGEPSYLLSTLSQLPLATGTGRWLFVGFMFAFAIKAPLVPLHTWLPDAAEESSPGGAVMMVGVMDKIGTFGMIRFCLGLFPEASQWATPVVLALAVISIIYGAILAIGSRNVMRFIAYTSISHFGFIVLGIFAFTTQSLVGSTLYMLNHGLSTAALFVAAGYLIRRRGSRDIHAYGGVERTAPVLAGLLLFAGLSTLSLPGLSSFVSEFMVLAGTFTRHPVHASVSTLAVVLAALYILIMYQRTMTGAVRPERPVRVRDVNARERLAMAPLVLLIVVLGVFPKPMLAVIEPAVSAAMQHVGVTDPPPRVSAEGGR
ncbi:MAG TPA: NADH-quinone oxidoreductase subunit M [Propionibacteriaceae bacterium]|nr:NADH-quinone oxidoreductase subunit M [Propionibacteriaceae bacterium]